jgi:hypothetical protein
MLQQDKGSVFVLQLLIKHINDYKAYSHCEIAVGQLSDGIFMYKKGKRNNINKGSSYTYKKLDREKVKYIPGFGLPDIENTE